MSLETTFEAPTLHAELDTALTIHQGASNWGEIGGDIEDQLDLQEALSEKADVEDIPTKTSELTNDSGFLTEHQSLAAYRTSAAQDIIDAGKESTIGASHHIDGDYVDYDESNTVNDKISVLSTQVSSKVDVATISTTAPTTLADNTIYNLTDVSTLDLSLAFPQTAFDCIINLTTAASGTITITFPTSIYIPAVPTFGNGETWTIWIRNNPVGNGGIITAQKAVTS